MKEKQKKRSVFEIAFSVLGYKENGEWVALALEMDIRGYGETFEKAIEDLMDLVLMQISFAHFKKQPEMIDRPASPVYWGLFASLREKRLRRLAEEDDEDSQYQIRSLGIPEPHIIDAQSRKFSPQHG